MSLYKNEGAPAPFVTQPLAGRRQTKAGVASEPVLNVLVIDDTPADRMAVRLALKVGGFALEEAADAEQGLKLARSSALDCILLDYVLPDAKGLDVLESLRQPDGTLPCAVVMLTGAGTLDVATAAMKAGALDYLVKDRLDADMLRRAIGSAVRQFRLIEAQHVAERRNAQLAAIVAASGDAIISVGADFVVQTWNAGAQRLFGYGEAEARGRRLGELIVPDAYEAESVAIHTTVVSGGTVLKEILRRHKDGQLVPVEINASPILDSSGKVTTTSIIYRDISERRRAEEARRALADSEARYRVTFENAPVGIAHVAPDGRWLRANEALCRILGYAPDELTAKSFQDVTYSDDIAASIARVDQMRDGKIDRYDADKRYLRKDGTIVWVRLTVSCVRKNDGSIDYLVTVVDGTNRDVVAYCLGFYAVFHRGLSASCKHRHQNPADRHPPEQPARPHSAGLAAALYVWPTRIGRPAEKGYRTPCRVLPMRTPRGGACRVPWLTSSKNGCSHSNPY